MIIKKISIKNFRSIENCKIDISNINVFSGCNDSGKSNLLKALNLFFNNKTDHDTEFDFESDFCHFSKTPNKTASEIKIEITLSPPKHYADSRDIVWRKKWRKGYDKEFEDKLYVPPSPKNSVHNSSKNWARKIRYRYVPAIKGENYFPHLLRDLYSTLAISIDSELKSASKNFVSTISTHTESMMIELDSLLHLGSRIRLPDNLSSLFEVLDFGTNHNGSSVSISKRGDGIKIRHIPSILKFLHDEENRIRTRGSVKVNTIWGYEEPENNLEFSSAFSKSEELLKISDEIQIFVSSHSPAFYSLKHQCNNARLFYTRQNSGGTSYSYIKSESDVRLADEEMGLLPIVAPYIEGKEKELKETRSSITKLKEQQTHNVDTIFVEGNTDKKIITKYLDRLSDHKFPIEVKSDVGAGSQWVRNNLAAWAMSPAVENTDFKAYGLLDKDNAGEAAKKSFTEYMQYVGRKAHEGKVKSSTLKPPSHLIKFRKAHGFCLNFSIEELFPLEVWLHAKEKGWLESRDHAEFFDMSILPIDKSIVQYISEVFNGEEDTIYLMYKVSNEFKGDFSNYVIEMIDESPEIFEGISINVKPIVEFFAKGRD